LGSQWKARPSGPRPATPGPSRWAAIQSARKKVPQQAGHQGRVSVVGTSDSGDSTTINLRRPILRVLRLSWPISSYSFVRPNPVARSASGTVQVSRSRKGISAVELVERSMIFLATRDVRRSSTGRNEVQHCSGPFPTISLRIVVGYRSKKGG
jgi:hypothetical protein